ncbi:unnamed protein product [Linum trigynum]|uniref:Uncharacterized protein n=1 Tax=Linum trigynum TaxID=586398 RepID=A0AAV2DEN1_9ROSI
MAFQKFTLGLRWNGYTEETGKGVTYVGGNFQKIKVVTRPLLEGLHQMCTNVTCMDGTRRVDRMVYRSPNRESGSLWHEEYLITTQDEVDSMLEFLRSNNLSKAEMFVYTEAAVGVGGHSGHGQTSGIHGGGELYGNHP